MLSESFEEFKTRNNMGVGWDLADVGYVREMTNNKLKKKNLSICLNFFFFFYVWLVTRIINDILDLFVPENNYTGFIILGR